MAETSPPLKPAATPFSPPVGGSGKAGYDLDSLPADAFGSSNEAPSEGMVTPAKIAQEPQQQPTENSVEKGDANQESKAQIEETTANTVESAAPSPAVPAAAAASAAASLSDETPLQRGTYDLSKLEMLGATPAQRSNAVAGASEVSEKCSLAERFTDKVCSLTSCRR